VSIGELESDLIDAESCGSMQDVRRGIDALDRSLVRLLFERQRFIEAAGRIKAERSLVRDEARIEEVIAKVTSAAKEVGLSRAIAEPVWRLLVEKSIEHELRVWSELHTDAVSPAATD
jgi:isochorismate pyruvate lyase